MAYKRKHLVWDRATRRWVHPNFLKRRRGGVAKTLISRRKRWVYRNRALIGKFLRLPKDLQRLVKTFAPVVPKKGAK